VQCFVIDSDVMEDNFSTTCPGIGGQYKRRYSDFVVEEVIEDGSVCKVERFLKEESEKKELLEIPENKEEKEQLHLELEKINKDLNYAIRDLTRYLGISKKRIGYGGMKDKRGITCQRISLFQPDLEKLKKYSCPGIFIKNARWSDKKIDLGDLKGNQFEIVIRDIELEEEEIKKRVNECFKQMENGIANFFGEQRFGGARKITHLVGKEFLKENPEEAVMLYLTATFPAEQDDMKQARLALKKTMDFSKASKEFPSELRYERAIIHHLCKYPKDFVGAFKKLPRKLQFLFTHAYQSWIFNKIIERRIQEGYGLKEIEGDVLEDGIPTAVLPGFESKLADGKAGEIERKIMEEENMKLADFKIKSFPEVSSKGARKKLALFPKDMKLIETGEDEFFENKKYAKISFYLDKGSYATTVLREMMKSGQH